MLAVLKSGRTSKLWRFVSKTLLFELGQGVCSGLLDERTGVADTAEFCVWRVVVIFAIGCCCVLTEEAQVIEQVLTDVCCLLSRTPVSDVHINIAQRLLLDVKSLPLFSMVFGAGTANTVH